MEKVISVLRKGDLVFIKHMKKYGTFWTTTIDVDGSISYAIHIDGSLEYIPKNLVEKTSPEEIVKRRNE